MPIPLSPNDRFPLSLKSDDDVAAEQRPTFIFRHLSGRRQRQVAVMLDELEKQKTTVEAIDKTYEILRFVLTGWEHVRADNQATAEALKLPLGAEVPYDPAACEDVLQYHEAQELIYRVWGYRPTADDLGNSGSQSSTPSAESASPAAAEGA